MKKVISNGLCLCVCVCVQPVFRILYGRWFGLPLAHTMSSMQSIITKTKPSTQIIQHIRQKSIVLPYEWDNFRHCWRIFAVCKRVSKQYGQIDMMWTNDLVELFSSSLRATWYLEFERKRDTDEKKKKLRWNIVRSQAENWNYNNNAIRLWIIFLRTSHKNNVLKDSGIEQCTAMSINDRLWQSHTHTHIAILIRQTMWPESKTQLVNSRDHQNPFARATKQTTEEGKKVNDS